MNISLDKELNRLKRADKNKIVRENPVDDIKLLLSTEAGEDLRISRAIGKQHSLTYGEEVVGKIRELENLEKTYGEVFSIEQIRDLAIKYNLRFLNSEYFTGNMAVEAIGKIKQFAKDTGADISGSSLAHKIFILAPEKCFKLTNVKIIRQKNLDPVMFYRLDTGMYRMIHKWGKDFTVLRLISGFKYKSFYNYVSTVFATLLPFSSILMTFLLPTSLKYEHPIPFVFITLVINSIATKMACWNKCDEGKTRKEMWSPGKWNSNEYIKYA